MSGTSLDGIDLCVSRFEFETSWKFQIQTAETVKYSENWKHRLRAAIDLNATELDNLNKEYTKEIKINSDHCLNYNTDSYLNIKVYKDSNIVIHDSKDYIYTTVLDLSFSILILLLFLSIIKLLYSIK